MKRFTLTPAQSHVLCNCIAFTVFKENTPTYMLGITMPLKHEYIWNILTNGIRYKQFTYEVFDKDVEEMLYCIEVFSTTDDRNVVNPNTRDAYTLYKENPTIISELIEVLKNSYLFMTDEDFRQTLPRVF